MYTHPDSKLKGLSEKDRRLAILQAVSDERKRFDSKDVRHVLSIVAHDLICAHDNKVWNGKNGQRAYMEVLATVASDGLTIAWKE